MDPNTGMYQGKEFLDHFRGSIQGGKDKRSCKTDSTISLLLLFYMDEIVRQELHVTSCDESIFLLPGNYERVAGPL